MFLKFLLTLVLQIFFVGQMTLAAVIPNFPKAKGDIEPKIPSPYQRCVPPLHKQKLEELFVCAEHEFWHGFSDGRKAVRKETEKLLSEIIKLSSKSPDRTKRGRVLALRGYLRLSMALEHAQMQYLIFGGLENDFKEAKKLDTENEVYDTFLDTIVMAKSAMSGDWKKATPLALAAFNILENHPANILALSGTTIGFPLNTGLPQKTIEFLAAWTCPVDTVSFCESNTLHAPYARPGLSFHYAEAYARMGNMERTLFYLHAAQNAPGFDTWNYQHLVQDALSDIEVYMQYWAQFGPDDSAFDKVYANQNFGCVMCHGR